MNGSPTAELLSAIDRRFAQGGPTSIQAALEAVLDHLGCVTGTIHRLDPVNGQLQLLAQRGLPEHLLPRVQLIPVGKGMAGLAALRRQPVQICNLQTDCSGAAQPAARETGMKGSIAVPMLIGGDLWGVLGVAKAIAHEFAEHEIAVLEGVASHLAAALRATWPLFRSEV